MSDHEGAGESEAEECLMPERVPAQGTEGIDGTDGTDGRIEGQIVQRGDAGYESVRASMVWNALKPQRFPDVIVRASSERDVPRAIGLARSRGLRIAVRAGGHSWFGSSVRDGGLLLDLSRLRRLDIHRDSATATVQPAVTGGELMSALAQRGLAFPAGHCPSVGLGGYLLSGGLGWNSGALGPACSSVVEIEAVTANGEVLRCDKERNADLFWAARGAGPGFFAIVTSFRLALYPLPQSLMTTTYAFPLADVERVTDWVTETADELDPTVESALVLSTAAPHMTTQSPRPRVVVAGATAFADSAEEAADALAPLQACPFAERALFSQLDEPTSFEALHDNSAAVWPPEHRYAVDTLWSQEDFTTLLTKLSDTIAECPSDKSLVLAPIPPVSSDEELLSNMAFSVLGRSYVAPFAVWDDPAEDDLNIRWLREAMSAVEPLGTGHYIAEADLTAAPTRAERSFTPQDWQRLQALRARYDPEGVFHSYLTPD
ncbi:FAD-binding oxidoreductase [Streptomyces sp. 8N706]|uniref:FAD-binding oxidoreductase n=1 Tax=Streptomyces sp. 8N706 TaxID=3457416 RepID=UPI003FD3CC17